MKVNIKNSLPNMILQMYFNIFLMYNTLEDYKRMYLASNLLDAMANRQSISIQME